MIWELFGYDLMEKAILLMQVLAVALPVSIVIYIMVFELFLPVVMHRRTHW